MTGIVYVSKLFIRVAEKSQAFGIVLNSFLAMVLRVNEEGGICACGAGNW